ncbi:MAG: FAD-binding oxidoreductase, partial [Salinigranum sp.]
MVVEHRLDGADVDDLRTAFRGEVLTPDDEGYDEARRVWNAMIDRRPAAIARCAGVADVIAAVNFARERDVAVAVRGGGHNIAGNAVCDDGLVIDLSEMSSVEVDPEAKTARVGPGATLAEFDHEAQAFGLATPVGYNSTTGIAGLTLGGGFGWLSRRYGLTIDNLRSVDVVTADGRFLHANDSQNEDLFWAVRGGGGNFGVVTAFEFDLHPVGPEVLGGPVFHPYEDAREALEFYREFTADAPDELACYALVVRAPSEEPFPEKHRGEPALVFAVCYAGPIAEGEAALAPLREFGTPIVDAIEPLPYTALQQSFDDGSPEGYRWYTKSHYLDDFPDGAIDTIIEYTDPFPGELTQVALEPMGGAIADVDPAATAFPHRNVAYSFGVWPAWTDPERDDELIAWAREFHEAMAPYAEGVYANYLDSDESDRVSTAYGPNYDRLVEVKDEWDPQNLFRVNQNIEPSG